MVRAIDAPASWHDLLSVHLGIGRRQAHAAVAGFPCVEIPILVHAAITGEEAPALPLAAACTLVYLGADLFDNLADHELPEEWAGWSPSQVNLAAATMLAPLPQLALAGLDPHVTPTATMVRLSKVVAGTLLTMAIGQHEDLLFSAVDGLTPEACRRVAERKGGGELGGFARAAAVLAGADPATEDAYATLGRCWGTGVQIASDLADLWDPEGSRDLLNGTPTLPIVHALTVLHDEQRVELVELLDEARRAPEIHPEVRRVLRASGSVDYTLLVVQVYARRAAGALQRSGAQQPARAALGRLLRASSVMPQRD